jgi:hypothetical protein
MAQGKPENLLADCIKTMQEIKMICNRSKRFEAEKEGIEEILELLKDKV